MSIINFIGDNPAAVTSVATICTIVGGGLGFILKLLIESNKNKSDKKALRQQMITNNIAPMRQAWINNLRDKISEFNMLARMIRVNTYSNLGTTKTLDNNQFKLIISNITKDIYQLNAISAYLDLLLPFNVNGEERREETSEKLRKAIQETVSGCEHLMKSIHEAITPPKVPINNTIDIEKKLVDAANSILSSTDDVSREAKMLLLEEWRETRSLKELE